MPAEDRSASPMARGTLKAGERLSFVPADARSPGGCAVKSARHRASHGPGLSCVLWLLTILLVIGLLPACSSVSSPKPVTLANGLSLVSQDVGPSGTTVHFRGGWVTVPAGALARRQVLHIRTAPALPSAPATRLMHPVTAGVSVDLSGLQPLSPLTIALSVPRSLPSGARPQTMFVATVPSSGPSAPVLLSTLYDSATQMLVAQSSHLSSFYAVWLDGKALVGQFTREMAEVLQLRAPQPGCAGQRVTLPGGGTVQFAPGAWSSGIDPLLWGCLSSADSDPRHVTVTLTDNRPMGYSVQIAPGASVSRDPPTLDSTTARLLFDIASLGKDRNLELLTPDSTVHITVPGTGLPSGTPVTVGAVRVNLAVVAASAAQTAFLLAAELLIPGTGGAKAVTDGEKAVKAGVDAIGNLECVNAELSNAASPGPDLIVNAAQLGLQCLGKVLKGAGATLTLAILGVVISSFATFTGMVNVLMSYFTGANTFTVALQRISGQAQQQPTQNPPTITEPGQLTTTPTPPATQPPAQQSPAPFSITSSSPGSGPASGGTLIVIHGTGFSSVTNVVMNSTEPPLPEGNPNYNLQNLHPKFTVVSDSQIDVTTTAGAAGFTYEIDVTTHTNEYFRSTYPGIPLFTYN